MKLAIEGMHCQSCVKRVQKALEKVEGAQVQSVEIGSAVVAPPPGQEEAILEAVRKAGYTVEAIAS
jgi:copper chaperone CopZ